MLRRIGETGQEALHAPCQRHTGLFRSAPPAAYAR